MYIPLPWRKPSITFGPRTIGLFRSYGNGSSTHGFKQQIVFATTIALVVSMSCCSKPNMKKGTIDELLSESAKGNEMPIESQAFMVEQIATSFEPQNDEYSIGPNDILNIEVIGHTEVSSSRDFNRGIVGTVVKKDGNIYLPIVGPVPAAGHTIEEFHRVLKEHLLTYIKNPQLTVDVLTYESQKFYVLGEVREPGAFPVDGDTTLLEAIGLAKGINPIGNLNAAYIIRKNTLLPINFANLLIHGDTSRNVYMRDDDLVYIPSSTDQKVYVLGEVHNPQAVQIPQGRISLTHALAEAGGLLTVDAKKRSIKLIRGSWQEPTVYTLRYKTVLAYGESIILKPGDRIVVEATGLTKASRYMEQILPFLQLLNSATAGHYRMSK
jgi:polysaccharide export outer membrane protein